MSTDRPIDLTPAAIARLRELWAVSQKHQPGCFCPSCTRLGDAIAQVLPALLAAAEERDRLEPVYRAAIAIMDAVFRWTAPMREGDMEVVARHIDLKVALEKLKAAEAKGGETP